MADLAQGRAALRSTKYAGFSTTKTFTALAMLRLAQEKKLSLDQPVKAHLPDFPYGDAITLRQLLSHSAGLPNPLPIGWIHLADEHAAFDSEAFFDGVFTEHPKVQSAPNEKFAYSNLGYVILGRVIAKVSGQPYEDYVRRHVLGPLGLDGSLSFELQAGEDRAVGYQRRWGLMSGVLGFMLDKDKYMGAAEGPWRPFKAVHVNGSPYGGLFGSLDGYVAYVRSFLQAKHPILDADHLSQLLTENKTSDGKATGMALGWWMGALHGHRYYCHAGGGGGYYCEIRFYPELRRGSVILFNRTGVSDERFLDQVDGPFLL